MNAAIEQSLLLKAFPDAKRSGSNGWHSARCPVHDDTVASLGVHEDANAMYGLRWVCHADKGCTWEHIRLALAAQGRLPEEKPYRSRVNRKDWGLVTGTYFYKDETNLELYKVDRFDPGPGHKEFPAYSSDGQGGWIKGITHVRKVLYNLPAVIQTDEVLVLEGEGDCETAKGLGFVATTNIGGCQGTWTDEYTQTLTSKRVIIIADLDKHKKGQERAQQIAKALHGKSASVKVIEMPGQEKHGWDLGDWVKAGGNAEQLRQLIDGAPEMTPQDTPRARRLINRVSLKEFLERTEEKTPFVVEDLFYQGMAHQFMGTIKAGKTTFLLRCVRAIVSGDDFLGRSTNPVNVLYVTEQPKASFETQLLESGVYRPDEKNIKELCFITPKELAMFDWPTRAQAIREHAQEMDAGLVIIDTFIKIALINDVANAGEMNRALEAITPLVNVDGRSLVLGWHERKASGRLVDAAQGTVAGGGAVDMIYRLQSPGKESEKTRKRTLESVGRLPAMGSNEPLVMELSEDLHGEYRVIGDMAKAKRATNEQRVLDVVPDEAPGIGEFEIVERIKADAKKRGYEVPSRSAISRAIVRLVEQELLKKTAAEAKAGNNRRPHALYSATNVPF